MFVDYNRLDCGTNIENKSLKQNISECKERIRGYEASLKQPRTEESKKMIESKLNRAKSWVKKIQEAQND